MQSARVVTIITDRVFRKWGCTTNKSVNSNTVGVSIKEKLQVLNRWSVPVDSFPNIEKPGDFLHQCLSGQSSLGFLKET